MSRSRRTTESSKNAGSVTDTGLSLSSPAYAMPTDQLLAACEVSVEKGLSAAQVEKRRQQYGSNQLIEAPPVPGDIVELEAGDNIPADSRLLSGFGLRVQEASLTGESAPVNKQADCVLNENAALGDRRNMVYMGTVAAVGKASAIVIETGMNTELGHIAGLLQRAELKPTPLQRRLVELGKVLVLVCLGIVVIIFNAPLQCWDLIVVGFARIPQHTETWGILANPTTQNRSAPATKRGIVKFQSTPASRLNINCVLCVRGKAEVTLLP